MESHDDSRRRWDAQWRKPYVERINGREAIEDLSLAIEQILRRSCGKPGTRQRQSDPGMRCRMTASRSIKTIATSDSALTRISDSFAELSSGEGRFPGTGELAHPRHGPDRAYAKVIARR